MFNHNPGNLKSTRYYCATLDSLPAFRSVSQGTLSHAGSHQHVQCENVWPHCQRVNTQARWRLQGLLASVRGQQDHSKGTLLPAGCPQCERWPMWDLTSLEKMERTVHSVTYRIFPGFSMCVFAFTSARCVQMCVFDCVPFAYSLFTMS